MYHSQIIFGMWFNLYKRRLVLNHIQLDHLRSALQIRLSLSKVTSIFAFPGTTIGRKVKLWGEMAVIIVAETDG